MLSIVAVLATLGVVADAAAQEVKLPAPTRTVYKCDLQGKVVYSDEPCLGAKKVDVEPTRGVSKMTGTERVGHDVQREKTREAFVEGIRPLTGKNAAQLDQRGRRMKLKPDAAVQCAKLDGEVARLESEEATARVGQRAGLQSELLTARKRYRELGC